MAAKLETNAVQEGDGRILRVTGDVDMDSSPTLRDEIHRALKGTPVLRVDLNGVAYLDSSGIAVLIQGLKEAQKTKTSYILLNPSAQVRAVIELAMLHEVFQIELTGET